MQWWTFNFATHDRMEAFIPDLATCPLSLVRTLNRQMRLGSIIVVNTCYEQRASFRVIVATVRC
jgi:hypothetical protein